MIPQLIVPDLTGFKVGVTLGDKLQGLQVMAPKPSQAALKRIPSGPNA